MTSVLDTCKRAAAVKQEIGTLGTKEKNRALLAIADALQAHRAEILAANQLDIDAGRKNGLNEGLIDRLTLGNDRIDGRGGRLPASRRPARPNRRSDRDEGHTERLENRQKARADGCHRHHL